MTDPVPSRTDVEKALEVFFRFGVDATRFTIHDLAAARREIARLSHPDHGGAPGSMAEVNAAHDTLRRHVSLRADAPEAAPQPEARPHETPKKHGTAQRYRPAPYRREREEAQAEGASAWTGLAKDARFAPLHLRIRRNDTSDRNFLRKSFWARSDEDRCAHHVSAFDGGTFTGLVIQASPSLERGMVAAVAELHQAETGRAARHVVVHRDGAQARVWSLDTMQSESLPAQFGNPSRPDYAERLAAFVSGMVP